MKSIRSFLNEFRACEMSEIFYWVQMLQLQECDERGHLVVLSTCNTTDRENSCTLRSQELQSTVALCLTISCLECHAMLNLILHVQPSSAAQTTAMARCSSSV